MADHPHESATADVTETPKPMGRLTLLTKRLRGVPQEPATIKISDLPDYVSQKLAQFDLDGDGLISIDEILQKGAEVEHLKYKARARLAGGVRLLAAGQRP